MAPAPGSPSLQFVLYDLLRQEHALGAGTQAGVEITRILDLAQAAYGDLVGLLVGWPDDVLDGTRDGEWSLRDILRHAIAVELRYGTQVEYAALRRDDQPIAIPPDSLPCDRLSPPEPAYAATRAGGVGEILELLGAARRRTDERLGALPDDTLARPSLWGTQPMTVRMRTHQIAVHLTECAIQSEKCLAAQGALEARRIIRHLCAARGAHERWSDPSARAELDERYRRSAAR
ncbi:MAG TPA: DinB family protein [Candidatus Limnocylindria bacterium]|nr:DinB family protein [Candidatus Limnocylindria bacterium]